MQEATTAIKPNRLSLWGRRIFLGAAVILTAFHVYTAWFGAYTAVMQRSLHLLLVLIAVYAHSVASRRGGGKDYYVKGGMDFLFIGVTLIAVGYIFFNYRSVIQRLGDHTQLDLVMGLLTMAVLLEGTRRVFGPVLPGIALFFIAYAFLGNLLPRDIFGHRGFGVDRVVSIMTYSTEGIFGVPLGASATIVAMFMVFAALYNGTDAGEQFLQLSQDMVGGLRAGPAKMAVVASSLFGTISGSAVANVVGTGTFTIPLMKRMGFEKEFAGAVEACSSTGGQFVPPIMGAAAFIMADMLGVSYAKVCVAAILPAFLYYVGLYFTVDLEAARKGLEGSGQRPAFRAALRRTHSLIPILGLFFLLSVIQWSPAKSALVAIVPILILDSIGKRKLWSLKGIRDCLTGACRGIIDVATATACAGLVVGIFSLTGLGLDISGKIITVSGGNIFILMTLTMITSIILGMGITTAAVYLILSVLVAPVMVQSGVLPLAAHMFVFYYGCLSAITPPVAVASYAAAGISGGDFNRTGWLAVKIALSGFIVPFILVLNPTLIMVGSPWEIAYRVVVSTVSVVLLSVALQNSYGLKQHTLGWTWRMINGVTALFLIFPETTTDLIGFVGLGCCLVHYVSQRAKVRKENFAHPTIESSGMIRETIHGKRSENIPG
jgi:TRAP transporter 4TM/12TM fusion protein